MTQGLYFELGDALMLAADKTFRKEQSVSLMGVENQKMEMKDVKNVVVLEGSARGKIRVDKALGEAVSQMVKFAEGYDLFTAEKVLMQISYAPKFQMYVSEMPDVTYFFDNFPPETQFIWGVFEDESIEDDKLVVRIIASNLKESGNETL